MRLRRKFIVGLSFVLIVSLAGCSASESGSSGTIDCTTGALSHGNGTVLNSGAMGGVEDGDVRLIVPLSVEEVKKQNINRIEVYNMAGKLAYLIPVSPNHAKVMANKTGVRYGQLRYEQYLGQRPFHGQYKVVAVNKTGKQVDFITIEFNCFVDVNA